MAVAIYDFNEIKRRVSCEDYLRERGVKVSAGRCAATWRGGKGQNVSIEGAVWHDFKTDEGGSVLDLCKRVEGLSDLQDTARILGERFHVEPKKTSHKPEPLVTRAKKLKELGYVLETTYVYTDEDGKPVYYVDRYKWPNPFVEPPEEFDVKEFVQRTDKHEGLDADTPHLLYHLPEVKTAQEVFIVEGEKDVETLRSLGFVATTNSGGASKKKKDGGTNKKWPNELNGWFAGKDVTIIADNDNAGKAHAQNLATMLAPVAKSVRSFAVSTLPKGDVTDWIEKEGGTAEALRAAVNALVPVAKPDDEEAAVAAAKEANMTPITNFILVGDGRKRRPEPMKILDIIKDIHLRFLGFPRRIGESTLFDHDRDTDEINKFGKEYDLFSWMQEKSGHPVNWEGGGRFTSRKELFSSLLRNTTKYERISEIPDWPMRSDVYYSYREKMVPTPGHEAFNRLVSFFSPDGRINEILIRAFIMAVMYYKPNIPRPCWIIDSTNGQAAGKTSLVDMVCYLFKSESISVPIRMLDFQPDEVCKRLVSFSGRNARVFLLDNVRGNFTSSFFADLVTRNSISGRAPYGEGHETRPNDLTYVITSNAARVDSDIASRAFTLYLRNPKTFDKGWRTNFIRFVDEFRYAVFADCIDICNGPSFCDRDEALTRTPEFEYDVLGKCCASKEEYRSVIDFIVETRKNINVENELATLVQETIEMRLDEILKAEGTHTNNSMPQHHDMVVAWIRTAVIDFWLKKQYRVDVQTLRNMIDTGKTTRFLKGLKRYPKSGRSEIRASGILYVGRSPACDYVPIINMNKETSAGLLPGSGWFHDPDFVREAVLQHAGASATVDAETSTAASAAQAPLPASAEQPALPVADIGVDGIPTEALPL